MDDAAAEDAAREARLHDVRMRVEERKQKAEKEERERGGRTLLVREESPPADGVRSAAQSDYEQARAEARSRPVSRFDPSQPPPTEELQSLFSTKSHQSLFSTKSDARSRLGTSIDPPTSRSGSRSASRSVSVGPRR